MRSLRSVLLVTALTCGLAVTPVFAEPSVDELQKDKENAQSEVHSLEKELTTLISKISQLEGDLVVKGEEISQAEEDLTEAQAKEEEQYDAMKLRIKFMYEEGGASFLEALVSAESFTDLVNKAEYVQNVHAYDRKMLEEYIEVKEKVKNLKSTLETELQNLESMQAEFESDKTKLDTTIENKRAEISNLDEQLQAAIEKAAEEQRRWEEEERRAEEERQAAADNNQSQANNSLSSSGTNSSGNKTNSSNTDNSGNKNNSNNTNNNTNNSGSKNEDTGNKKPSSSVGQGNTATAQKIVDAAYSQLGVPYKWGGSTPNVAFDCSGLVQYCHKVAGISLPHSSSEQYAGGKKVSNPQPGDICYKPGHVAIYIGNGKMIEAQQTGTNIMISPVRATAYVRYW